MIEQCMIQGSFDWAYDLVHVLREALIVVSTIMAHLKTSSDVDVDPTSRILKMLDPFIGMLFSRTCWQSLAKCKMILPHEYEVWTRYGISNRWKCCRHCYPSHSCLEISGTADLVEVTIIYLLSPSSPSALWRHSALLPATSVTPQVWLWRQNCMINIAKLCSCLVIVQP